MHFVLLAVRGLAIVLTITTGAALFAAEAYSGGHGRPRSTGSSTAAALKASAGAAGAATGIAAAEHRPPERTSRETLHRPSELAPTLDKTASEVHAQR